MILGPNITGSYVILFFTASDFTFTTRHNHNFMSFLLWLSFYIPSGAISQLFSSSILDTFLPGWLIFWYQFFFCLFILFLVNSRTTPYWSGLPFPSPVDHILSELSTMTCLGWPYMARLSFIELDKAVVHVIRLASFLSLWFQSVCPLMPSLSTYCLTGVSLTLDMGISSWLLQQSAAAAPYLGRGVFPLRCHS